MHCKRGNFYIKHVGCNARLVDPCRVQNHGTDLGYIQFYMMFSLQSGTCMDALHQIVLYSHLEAVLSSLVDHWPDYRNTVRKFLLVNVSCFKISGTEELNSHYKR